MCHACWCDCTRSIHAAAARRHPLRPLCRLSVVHLAFKTLRYQQEFVQTSSPTVSQCVRPPGLLTRQSAHLFRATMATSTPLTFSTKAVRFHGDTKRIVLQNENGPCPLLAILNALILQDKLQLPSGSAKLDSSKLQHLLVGHIVDRTSALGTAGGDQQAHAANLQHQIDDTINLVMKGRFIEGMDVNLEFGSCSGFEYTSEVRLSSLSLFPCCAGSTSPA